MFYSTFFLLVSLQSVCGETEDLKTTIQSLNSSISHASTEEKGPLQVQLAIAYYKDQEQEKAFRLFLDALASTPPPSSNYQPTPQEEELYHEALKIYLSHNSPRSNAEELKKKYDLALKNHADYANFGFILCAAYANLGEFPQFFSSYYASYQKNPTHYLAYKSKAALHIKLMERSRSADDREKQKERILKNAKLAVEHYPQDTTLYKLILMFTKDGDRATVLGLYLRKIIDSNIVIPRSDVAFYVEQAVTTGQWGLAQQFINKAREWYAFSKGIDAAQHYLDQHKKKANSA